MPSTSFPFFGYHCDIARGAYFRPASFHHTLRLAAQAGCTHFLPYLENLIALPSQARACPAAAYTPDQWREFEVTAALVGISLVPHFNVIGHTADACRAYPELTGGQGGHELDPLCPAAQDWVRRCLNEFCDLSPCPYILIGGDEWQPPAHLLRDPGFSAGVTWARHINLAVETVRQRGRRAIVWHDLLLHYPDAIPLLDRDAILAFWFYDESSEYAALGMFREWGFTTIMAAGLCGGGFSGRRIRAVQQALAATTQYRAHGFMLTSWERQRCEDQPLFLDWLGRLGRGEALPAPLVEAMTLQELLRHQGLDQPALAPRRAALAKLLDDPAWQPFPEAQQRLRAWVAGDTAADLRSFLTYHHAEGPIHASLAAPATAAPPAPRLQATAHAAAGDGLRIVNGDETFIVYPKYGATLQDWRLGPHQLVPHSLPDFLARGEQAPGGYRSYTAAGGFRAIWALGTHHNPNILWNYPYAWRCEQDGPARIVIELTQRRPHVDMLIRLIVQQGQPGFTMELQATNHLPLAWGGFNWNLPFAFAPADATTTELRYQHGRRQRRVRFRDQLESAFMLPARTGFTFAKRAWAVTVTTDAEQTGGFFTDWSTSYVTPDLHAHYRRLLPGDTLRTTWRFVPEWR